MKYYNMAFMNDDLWTANMSNMDIRQAYEKHYYKQINLMPMNINNNITIIST